MRAASLLTLLPSLLSICLAQEAAGYPPCALRCILQALPQTTCAATNQTCLCHDSTLSRLVEPCISAGCTIKEALVTANITSKSCGFPEGDDSARATLASLNLLTILPTVSIILRMKVKIRRWSAWGADDSTIVAAYVLMLTFVPINILLERNGQGRNLWTFSFDQVDRFFLIYYISQPVYYASLALIKASILLLLLRIFPGGGIRLTLWGTQAVNLIICVGIR
ncbi:CFEM domain-containing protein [Colletotrichum graminicola]|nr:CFEM domain-containing protein [Colletotrichum graminicola]